MTKSKAEDVLKPDARIRSEVFNINDAVETELGYIKAILHAVGVMARQDSEMHLPEIVRLVECAHWIGDNLESNIDYFGEQILHALPEVANA